MDDSILREKVGDLVGPRLGKVRSLASTIGVVGLIAWALGAFLNPRTAMPTYLYGYMFWFGVTAGSLGFLLLHHTVGGGWGFLIRRFIEAATRPAMWFLLILGFIPIAVFGYTPPPHSESHLGLGMYEWAHHTDPILQAKAFWLNPLAFFIRTAVYFAILLGLSYRLHRLGDVQDVRNDIRNSKRLTYTGGFGILVFVLTITFAAVDWVMSLTPHWFSSIIGLLFVSSEALATLAVMLVLLAMLVGNEPLRRGVDADKFRDLGNLMLATVMLWAYMSFSQYIITYSGNTVEEGTWYQARNTHGWNVVPWILMPFHFGLPFLILLLGSDVKKTPTRLARVGIYLILMRWLDLCWWVTPTFQQSFLGADGGHLGFYLASLGAPLLLGGIWLFSWASNLRLNQTAVPLHDPRVAGNWLEVVESA